MNIAELKNHLSLYPDDMPCASILWTPEDVQQKARERRMPKPTPAECAEVLESIHRHHDANYGITWDTIESELQDLHNRKLALHLTQSRSFILPERSAA